ncbi:MAG: sigma-54-dependent Fis family transcriptional regulator [Nitrospiraceae bacterium]|nr:MAG: sigma-54-dependent Fis family transcriptional regulator [Nitrospiraceae bacterium]
MINPTLPILLVDDEQKILFSYSLMLKSSGIHNVLSLQDSREVVPFLEKQDVSIIVLDLVMPHISGIELLNQIRLEFPHIPIIVMTALNELEKAVQCMKAGASDYLVKPVEESRFLSSIQNVLEVNNLKDEITSLKRHLLSGELEHSDAFAGIITKSKKMTAIFRYIEAIAESQKPILITGETGVGKELLARSVHMVSGLKGSHVAVNVAGLDDTIFSDTLFGHRKGAYTGADKDRQGLITKASEGTLLLDEIGDLNKSSQVKILRLLEEKIYYPLGSDAPEKSDARVIACCNQEIPTLIEADKFRKDLYYRLCAHHIHLPPLRERAEDIPLLLDHFLEDASKSLKKEKPVPSCEVVALLSSYDFPGNIRELQAMVHHAVAEHKTGRLSLKGFRKFIKKDVTLQTGSLPVPSDGNNASINEIFGHFPGLKEMEDYLITEAMKSADNNQGAAAALLGISRQALNQRLKKKEKSS